jgi:hypothetical protein
MLTTDLVFPFGQAQRGQALVDSWQDAAIQVLALGDGSQRTPRAAFARKLKDFITTDAEKVTQKPLIIFTATNADTGGAEVLTNAPWRMLGSDRQKISIGVAALHSARFPLISPAGKMLAVDGKHWIRLVDGGYYDNSGAWALLDVLRSMPPSHKPRKPLTVVRISGNAESDDRCQAWNDALVAADIVPWQFYWMSTSLSDKEKASLIVKERQARERRAREEEQKRSRRKAAGLEAPDAPPLQAGAWSAGSAFWAARIARAEDSARAISPDKDKELIGEVANPIRLDYTPEFLPNCDLKNKKKIDECLERNSRGCFHEKFARRAPLGWYVSWGAAGGMEPSVMLGALDLLRRMEL